MTQGPQGSGMLHHDEGHAEALGTTPITLLVQVGDSDPMPVGRETIPLYGVPGGDTITLDEGQAADDIASAIIRILAKDPHTRHKKVRA